MEGRVLCQNSTGLSNLFSSLLLKSVFLATYHYLECAILNDFVNIRSSSTKKASQKAMFQGIFIVLEPNDKATLICLKAEIWT